MYQLLLSGICQVHYTWWFLWMLSQKESFKGWAHWEPIQCWARGGAHWYPTRHITAHSQFGISGWWICGQIWKGLLSVKASSETRSWFQGWHQQIIVEVPVEYVAVSLNICPWQDPMQLGVKLKITPCNLPGCRRYVKWVARWGGNKYQHSKLHDCSYITLLNLQHILFPPCYNDIP